MTLQELTSNYVEFRKAAGGDFTSTENLLKTFGRVVGWHAEAGEIQNEQVRAFLDGQGRLTRYWHRKHSVLFGFYRYAVSRGYVTEMPISLSAGKPKQPPSLEPYIYTRDEIRRLLDATVHYQKQRFHIKPLTFRTLLLLLYGAGLRIGEAVRLSLADVDLSENVLTIRETKFYKTRLVPLGTDLSRAMNEYAVSRRAREFPQNPDASFFIDRTGAPLVNATVRRAFGRLRAYAGVVRNDGARYQPRLHDLRHVFTVHRLTSWYRSGADVQKLLPRLSTYLGHLNIASTQTYLTMTPELLHEASLRFEKYAIGGSEQ